jgi:glycolate oxidase iron-sulfur subunit
MVITSNPGCILQIAAGLQRAGRDIPVKHMIEIVDASISGKTKDLLAAKKN